MPAPTAAEIRSWSQVPFAELGFDTDEKLERLVAVATATFTRYTGQSWDGGGVYSNIAPAQGTEVLATDAIQTLTEIAAYQKQADRLETFQDFDLIQSFGAGGYNEARRSADDYRKLSEVMLNGMLGTLKPLMTTAKLDEYAEAIAALTGQIIPAFAVTEVAWAASPSSGEYLAMPWDLI